MAGHYTAGKNDTGIDVSWIFFRDYLLMLFLYNIFINEQIRIIMEALTQHGAWSENQVACLFTSGAKDPPISFAGGVSMGR